MDIKKTDLIYYYEILNSNETKRLLQNYLKTKKIEELKNFSKIFIENNIPYLEVSFFIEDFFKEKNIKFDRILNYIAKEFLEIKLKEDKKFFNIELQKAFIYIIDERKNIINAHLQWALDFINAIINNTKLPEMDEAKCIIGNWIDEQNYKNNFESIKKIHHSIHILAKDAYQFYTQKQFHRFFLLYIDIIHFNSLFRQKILQHFTQNELVSLTIDPLTKLQNRFALLQHLKSLDDNTTLFLFNIKDFSKINLLFGQEIGDKVLENIADSLNKISDIKSYRIYGDEFGIILNTKDSYKKINKIINMLENKTYPEKEKLINISIYGAYAKVSHHLLEKVEFGIISARKKKEKIINVDSINKEAIKSYAKNLELSQRLKLAFADNRLYLHYQPIYNIKTSKIEKYECLLRFEDVDGNILNPESFLDVLKNMYIYPEVTKMIIISAFEKFENEPYEFSINLSFSDIVNEKTTQTIVNILNKYPKVAKRAVFELLEYDAILNFDKVKEFFFILKQYGAKISLDDFGSGYSNFAYILRLDIDYIKLDGSIVQNILLDNKVRVLVSAMIHIAEEIGAKTIAEFVSTEQIFEAVKVLGVDYAQGYYIGKPKSHLISEK